MHLGYRRLCLLLGTNLLKDRGFNLAYSNNASGEMTTFRTKVYRWTAEIYKTTELLNFQRSTIIYKNEQFTYAVFENKLCDA